MITENDLLTSATCVSRLINQDLKLFNVVLGSKHLIHPSHSNGGLEFIGIYRTIEEVRVHENYTINTMSLTNQQRIRNNDIGKSYFFSFKNLIAAFTCENNLLNNF